MNASSNSETLEKLAQYGVEVVGNIVAIGVAFCLLTAWIITGPIFLLCDRIAYRRKSEFKTGTKS